MADKKDKGKLSVVVSIGDAQRELARQRRHAKDPPPAMPRGANNDIPPGKWAADKLGLPAEPPSPVVPLGIEGETHHLIDSSGQFRSLAPSDFSHSGIQSLFAECPNYPQWAWPRYGRKPPTEDGEKPKPAPIKSFEDDKVREALFMACARKGLFSPTDKLRGRGAWRLRGGQIIYHAGEELWVCEHGRMKVMETGLYEGHLYPRLPPLPAPWTEPVAPEDHPAGPLLETLRMWHWERPDVDPLLMLGWIGVAYLGGALDWRSAVQLIGDKGTGKSTLHEGLKALFGDALFHSADTSAAGIYQKMAHDTRPVAVDELEAAADQRKVDAVVTLMRAASSGALGRRGGATGTPTEYQMRSAFLFSSINNPLHGAQDFSRVATLRLRKLLDGAPRPPAIDTDTCGRIILATLMRQWTRFPAVLEAYRGALADGGHDARGQDTYGTLLACADLMLGPELAGRHDVRLTDDLPWWSENLGAEKLPEIEDAKPNWRKCLEHLLTVQIDLWRGGARATIAQCIEDLRLSAPNQDGGIEAYGFSDAKRDMAKAGVGLEQAFELINRLAKCNDDEGLPFGRERAAEFLAIRDSDGPVLAIPNDSPRVKALFADMPWAGGGWRDALRQCDTPGVMLTDKRINKVSVAGLQQRCTLVVMKRFDGAPER